MSVLTTGQAIVQSLIRHGVDTVFGIPGAHTYDFIDALYQERDRIRFIQTRHEQGAGYMAYGYAKATGRPGVYTVVPGPGVLNSGAALCTAYGANTPVLCITANIMSHLIGQGRGQLHELPDQLATLRGLTKWAQRIDHPTNVSTTVAEAFRQLGSGRIRPVALEVPWDVLGIKAEVAAPLKYDLSAPPPPDAYSIEQAAGIIRQAKNPLITVGAGALDAGAEVLELAMLIQAPVSAHRSGKGIVSDDNPYAMSPAAAFKHWRNVDCLIGIGSRLELEYFRWRWFPSGVKVIRIDIDPTEMVRLKPDVGIVGDAVVGTRALIDALDAGMDKRISREQEFATLKAQVNKEIQVVQPQMGYLNAIREVLPRDGFFVEEISQVGFAARFGFPVYEPRQYVTCGYQDNLGFGFNTALGVKVAHPDKAVVSICGDGGFMFGVQELATAVQQRINLVTIVFNNNAYGNVLRDQQQTYGGHVIGSELVNPDFVKLAQSFGAIAYRATSPGELRSTLTQALADDAPVIIDVPVAQGSEVSPWQFLHPPSPQE